VRAGLRHDWELNMSNLSQVQTTFTRALLDPHAPLPAVMRSPRNARGFAVYRNNVAMGLLSALAARYPVVKRLVGGEFFCEMSRRYVAAAPPRSPIMLYYGDTFPAFIETFEPARSIPYLAAVARIEMARGLAYHAADAGTLSADAFVALAPGELADLRVTLHPSVSIVTSAYPIYSIWKVNQNRAPVVPVSPWAPEAVLIARSVYAVQVHRLARGQDVFLRTLADGEAIAQAIEAGIAEAPDFDVAQSLALLINTGIVVGFGYGTKILQADQRH
jgi:hypothetical protein